MIRRGISGCLVTLVLVISWVPPARPGDRHRDFDRGIAGLQQMLRKLRTTARLLHITAHPDDEDGALLALVARGLGATTMLLTLTRGEGGQNRIGSELFDALGLLRTLELMASDATYGVQQRFTRVADFGFSKSADETFQKWKGQETVLADIVRVMRAFRPDVVVARWQGSASDGHGNHQAAGLLAREAFRAAGDARRFPELEREGLVPWQPKKLYHDNLSPEQTPTVHLPTSRHDPVLGTTYAHLGAEGLRYQLSQGAGGIILTAGPRASSYRLVESLVAPSTSDDGAESDLFEGLDTTLPGLASRLGEEEKKVPFLRPTLMDVERKILDAVTGFTPENPSVIAPLLLAASSRVTELLRRIEQSPLSPTARADMLVHLQTKKEQCEEAARLALGLALEAVMESSDAPSAEARSSETFVSPGQTLMLRVTFQNQSSLPVEVESVSLETPPEWSVERVTAAAPRLRPLESTTARFRVTVSPREPYTRPYWHRTDWFRETIVTLDDPRWVTLPLPPAPLVAHLTYTVAGSRGELRRVAEAKQTDPLYGEEYRSLLIGPPLSVAVSPSTRLLRADQRAPTDVTVSVRSVLRGPAHATVRLIVPSAWRVEPSSHPISFTRAGDVVTVTFRLRPEALRPGDYEIRAIVEHEGKTYDEGYVLIGRREIGWFPFYRQARQRVRVVEVKLPHRLRIGYIMGAGDEIPDVLQQIGLTVELISPSELAGGDLQRFDVIVVGIRAYDVRQDVREHNRRLLDYVAQGGTLLVQYNQNVSAFNAGNYTPYPARLGNRRVSVEEAPVRILVPADSVFHRPNEITRRDFDGWIQERGLYFMESWDERFTPLLESHDPGEEPLRGGLLRARYGRGTYLFTGYAFFRQVPAGVPGAVRLFVNLLASGRR